MSNALEDRRVKRTKKQLRAALTTLLRERNIDRITVRDVAELANVNRGTFYAHYRDMRDLLSQMEKELLGELEKLGEREKGGSYAYFCGLFHLVEEYADVFYPVCCGGSDMDFFRIFYRTLQGKLSPKSAEVPKGEYSAAYIASGVYMLLRVWLENGRRESAEEMAELSHNLTAREERETQTAR